MQPAVESGSFLKHCPSKIHWWRIYERLNEREGADFEVEEARSRSGRRSREVVALIDACVYCMLFYIGNVSEVHNTPNATD